MEVLTKLVIDQAQACVLSDREVEGHVMQNVIRKVEHTSRHDSLSL